MYYNIIIIIYVLSFSIICLQFCRICENKAIVCVDIANGKIFDKKQQKITIENPKKSDMIYNTTG